MDIKTAPLGRKFTPIELKNQCKAVYGAVAWPGKQPGFVVVLAIVYSQEQDNWQIYLLDEFESFDMQELIRQCVVLNSKYEPCMWVGDTTNDSAEEFMCEMTLGFYLSETDLVEMEPFYPYVLGKLKEFLNREHRRLFLKDSKVLNYMAEIERDEEAELKRGDFPALEAVIYATVESLRMVDSQSIAIPTRTGESVPAHNKGRFQTDRDLARMGVIDRQGEDDDMDEEAWYHTV
jgi:hypothetical protein